MKARGKRKDNNKWIHGWYFEASGKSFILPIYSPLSEFGDKLWVDDFIEIIPETRGWFSGKKDKDGIEVYSGDLIETDNPNFGYCDPKEKETMILEVKWDPEEASFLMGGNEMYPRLDYYKVVGTIHDKK